LLKKKKKMSTTTVNAARFDGKEDNYVKYRPSYPTNLISNVLKETNLFTGDLFCFFEIKNNIRTKYCILFLF